MIKKMLNFIYKKFKCSLSKKAGLTILFFMTILVSATTIHSYIIYTRVMDSHFIMMAENMAKTAVAQLDGDRIEKYFFTRKKDKVYEEMKDKLFVIKDNNDILNLSVIKAEKDTFYYIFDTDHSVAAHELGQVSEIPKEILTIYSKNSKAITTIIQEVSGRICTSYAPVLNSEGDMAALVKIDISMDHINDEKYEFLIFNSFAMSLIGLIFIIVMYLLTKKFIVKPINVLAKETSKFVSDRDQGSLKAKKTAAELNIRTGDEIEKLSKAIVTMEKEIILYIDDIKKLTQEHAKISVDLKAADMIQAGMLPYVITPLPVSDQYEVYASVNPVKEFGKDLYDIFIIREGLLGFVIADVYGEGVSAAFFMLIVKTLIKNLANVYTSPAELFVAVNKQMCENNKSGMFVTAFMGTLDLSSGKMTYCNAGHEYPLLYHREEGYQWIKSKPGFVLAGMDGIQYKNYELQLKPGDRLIMYTDGLIKQVNPAKDIFGYNRFQDVLNKSKNNHLSLSELDTEILKEVKQFAQGTEQTDDITILSLEFKQFSLLNN